MSKIAVIGASYLQLPLVKKAKDLGHEVFCFAWDKDAVCKEIADYFYPISITEKEKILTFCERIGIEGICTIASDVAAPTVAYVAEEMHLNSNTYESACKANNKYLMRQVLEQAGVPCPKYKVITDLSQLFQTEWHYPLIVKPSDRSGSLGVKKVENKKALFSAVEEAISLSFKGEAMVEEFIEGREISVEFISYHGRHYPLQITDKVTTEAPYFVELEHHQPAALSKELFSTIYTLTEKALSALGLTDGASHSEFRITPDGNIVTMEIGGRMGGDFIGSDLVSLSTGYDFVKGVIQVALDKFDPPVLTVDRYSGIYFLSKEAERVFQYIKAWPMYPQIVKAQITDSELHEIRSSSERSGYLIYTGDKKWEI